MFMLCGPIGVAVRIYWLLATGYWLLATGYWKLATGNWLLETELLPLFNIFDLRREDIEHRLDPGIGKGLLTEVSLAILHRWRSGG